MLKCFYLTCQSLSQLEVQLFVGFLVCMGVRRRQFAYLFSGVWDRKETEMETLCAQKASVISSRAAAA